MFPNLKNYKSATRTLQLTEATVSACQGYIFFFLNLFLIFYVYGMH